MTSPLIITLAQLNPIVGDIAYNTRKIKDAIKNKDAKSDIIVFPELFLSGYPPEDLVLNASFLSAIRKAIDDIIETSKQHETAILIGCPWEEDGKTYNAALLIHKGQILSHHFKKHLPNYGVFDEQRVFTAGQAPHTVHFKGYNLGIMICEDLWFPDVAADLKQQGADLLIVFNASPFTQHKVQQRLDHVRARVRETELPLLYLNQVGGQDELVFDGQSFVMGKKCDIVAGISGFEEDTMTVSFSAGSITSQSQDDTAQHDLTQETPRTSLSNIYQALCLGLKDYVNKNGFPGVLIGLSGGVDSALVTTIAVDALGPDRVKCLCMPSQYTSPDSLEDAEHLSQNLGLTLDITPITSSQTALNDTITDYVACSSTSDDNDSFLGTINTINDIPSVTFENIQSRLRGVILMALSNTTGYIVATTGNKSEMAVGYATLYGDMCGGFNPLKDIYKTMVYDLCRWRNTESPVIPERILTKAPSAELKDNQTDQDTLPPYDILDDILSALIEEESLKIENVSKKYTPTLVNRIHTMLKRAEYKRRQAPPGVKITTKAFGRDRRYPITNGFNGAV